MPREPEERHGMTIKARNLPALYKLNGQAPIGMAERGAVVAVAGNRQALNNQARDDPMDLEPKQIQA